MCSIDFNAADPRNNRLVIEQVIGYAEQSEEEYRLWRKEHPFCITDENNGTETINSLPARKRLLDYLTSLNMDQIRAVSCAYEMFIGYEKPRIDRRDPEEDDWDGDEEYDDPDEWVNSVIIDFLKTNPGASNWTDKYDELAVFEDNYQLSKCLKWSASIIFNYDFY